MTIRERVIKDAVVDIVGKASRYFGGKHGDIMGYYVWGDVQEKRVILYYLMVNGFGVEDINLGLNHKYCRSYYSTVRSQVYDDIKRGGHLSLMYKGLCNYMERETKLIAA